MRAAMIKRWFAKVKVGGGSSHGSGNNNSGHSSSKLDKVSIYMIWRFVGLACSFAGHTGFQRFNKHTREETMPQVSHPDPDPDRTLNCADKFVKKVAHIQDDKTTLNHSSRPNPFTASEEDDDDGNGEQWTEVVSWEPRVFIYHNFLKLK
ncbi:hypothetical protein PIB30_055733 [Stylosanthes scabra]|uniref:Uncharacterized protein n=1 Tax=Stylosanthes scabra TaxID=79078 RepID=A0ABU6QIM1_9FABA|nr:hypothetical protein [Stylosanthes scabra]